MGREIFALFCLMGNTNCTSWLFCEARYLARAQPHLLARVPQHLGLQPVKLAEGNLCWFAAGEFPVFDLVCCSFCPEVFLSFLLRRKQIGSFCGAQRHFLLTWAGWDPMSTCEELAIRKHEIKLKLLGLQASNSLIRSCQTNCLNQLNPETPSDSSSCRHCRKLLCSGSGL